MQNARTNFENAKCKMQNAKCELTLSAFLHFAFLIFHWYGTRQRYSVWIARAASDGASSAEVSPASAAV